jgi:hypothetical protein
MELVNITYSGEGRQPVELTPLDQQLVTSNFINSNFGADGDYIELFIYDQQNTLIDVDYDAFDYYPFLLNNPQNNTYSALTLEPEKDLRNRGYNRGNLTIQYNFYKKLFNSQFGTQYWIKEISQTRREIKLASQVLSDAVIRDGFTQYQSYIATKNYYPIFYLNFGNNIVITANNVALTEDEEGSYLLIRLYEPLPTEFDLKTQLWIVDKVAESVSFNVDIQVQVDPTQDVNALRGPNYNVVVNTKNGQTTPYYNYDNLITSPVTSSFQKLLSYYQDRSIDINVDYSNFSNFIHFSNAEERVRNFVYKLQLIESANTDLAAQRSIVGGSGTSTILSSSIDAIQQRIDNIVKNFDLYEYFLYFNSSSWAWPKSSNTQPYALYSVTSSQASNFLGSTTTVPTATTQSLLFSASYYDSTNKDALRNFIPQYLLDDSSNQPYITFVDMIGQHFDNIWLYYKDVSNRYNNTNNPDTGISLDLVSDALRGFGMQLYTNSNVSDNLYYTLFGINEDGSLLPPTGSEVITNYVTSSLTTLPAATIQDEYYKRIYHNLPYLLKTKGTERSVKALVATYGIPESILTVREFGGNPISGTIGVLDMPTSDFKVSIATGSAGIVTGSLELSSSLLSSYTTLQYYTNNDRLNSSNVEIGFSPADVINANISASQGYFDINQLIGAPGYQYSSSYQPLVSASNAYFATYTQPNSIWEYIRLLKFYNNSLFKFVKDFVPARANVSTGIIVKSHLYERNKYPRHEPNISFNDYSQSIDMVSISGSYGDAISGSTYWDGFVTTPLGPASYISSQNIELYNGEFSGSKIVVTSGEAFDQDEPSNLPGTGSGFIQVNLGALYQNVTSSVRSVDLFDLDYSSDQLIPVNYGIVTQSISASQVNNYATYTNPNSPYAQVQDYNYNLERSIIPRYRGSKTISAEYNTESPANQSYGDTAAIDKIKYQYAYLVDIYSGSMFLPNRSNAQIKYIIDNDQNVLDLTKANKNIFTVQNVFKSQETTNISLFDYDEANPYTQQLANNPDLEIYEGGWRYLPILHNLSGSNNPQVFTLRIPERTEIQQGSGVSPSSSFLDPNNWSLSWWVVETQITPGAACAGDSDFAFYVSASYTGPGGTNPGVVLTLSSNLDIAFQNCVGTTQTFTIPVTAGNTTGVSDQYGPTLSLYSNTGNGSGNSGYLGPHWPTLTGCTGAYPDCSISIDSIGTIRPGGGGGGTGGGSTTFTFYQTEFSSSQACLYFLSQSNEVLFNSTMSYYYNSSNGPITFKSTSDPFWSGSSLPPAILPFTLQTGDKISFYNTSSLGWDELFEYTIKSVRQSGSVNNITGSVLLVELDKPVNLALFNSGSSVPTESITGAQFRTCRYIVWKHVPDETNVMLRYNPKDSTLVENGLLFPEYIDPIVRDNAGNVVKALKQQNLIQ